MTFREFLAKYQAGTMDTDAAWRAYDIPAGVAPRHITSALKSLGLTYAGELAIPEFMARYGIINPNEARAILGAWWLWSSVDRGRTVRVPLRARTA